MTQGSFVSTFTPSDEIHSGITIGCTVYEGLIYSYADGNYDDSVDRTWSATLNTFKVTIYSQPGNIVYSEDDANASRQFGGLSNGALDLGNINRTGVWSQPGATPTPALSGSISRSITWTTRCETASGVVRGIMGSVSFIPSIDCDGEFHVAADAIGLVPPGTIGNVMAGFAAAYNPYAGAAVLFTNWALGSKPETNYGFIGESIIENGSGTPPRIDHTGSVLRLASTTIDLAGLSISRPQSTSLPQFTANGSIDIKTQLQCYDHSISSEVWAFLKVRPGSPVGVGATTWGSSRPSYSNPN
jgi:hypothetical protein